MATIDTILIYLYVCVILVSVNISEISDYLHHIVYLISRDKNIQLSVFYAFIIVKIAGIKRVETYKAQVRVEPINKLGSTKRRKYHLSEKPNLPRIVVKRDNLGLVFILAVSTRNFAKSWNSQIQHTCIITDTSIWVWSIYWSWFRLTCRCSFCDWKSFNSEN